MSFFTPRDITANVYQGSDHVETLTMTFGGSPIALAADYDDIVCEIRDGVDTSAPLVKRITLGAGITISNTNDLNLNLTTTYKAGKYFGDVRFLPTGESPTGEAWVTLIALTVNITPTKTRVNV